MVINIKMEPDHGNTEQMYQNVNYNNTLTNAFLKVCNFRMTIFFFIFLEPVVFFLTAGFVACLLQ